MAGLEILIVGYAQDHGPVLVPADYLRASAPCVNGIQVEGFILTQVRCLDLEGIGGLRIAVAQKPAGLLDVLLDGSHPGQVVKVIQVRALVFAEIAGLFLVSGPADEDVILAVMLHVRVLRQAEKSFGFCLGLLRIAVEVIDVIVVDGDRLRRAALVDLHRNALIL